MPTTPASETSWLARINEMPTPASQILFAARPAQCYAL